MQPLRKALCAQELNLLWPLNCESFMRRSFTSSLARRWSAFRNTNQTTRSACSKRASRNLEKVSSPGDVFHSAYSRLLFSVEVSECGLPSLFSFAVVTQILLVFMHRANRGITNQAECDSSPITALIRTRFLLALFRDLFAVLPFRVPLHALWTAVCHASFSHKRNWLIGFPAGLTEGILGIRIHHRAPSRALMR